MDLVLVNLHWTPLVNSLSPPFNTGIFTFLCAIMFSFPDSKMILKSQISGEVNPPKWFISNQICFSVPCTE